MEMTVKGWRGFHYGLAVAFVIVMAILAIITIRGALSSGNSAGGASLIAEADFRVITYDKKSDGRSVARIRVFWTGIDNLDRNVTELMRLLGSAGWEEADDMILQKGSLLPIGCSIRIVASEKAAGLYPYVLSGCDSSALMTTLYRDSEREHCLGILNVDRRCGYAKIGMS